MVIPAVSICSGEWGGGHITYLSKVLGDRQALLQTI